ncbi:MAG: HlyD family secretion protein [Planctomycetota bacterium]|jgi:multidrug resistance efflux pump
MGRISLRSGRLFLRVLPVLVWLSAVACVVGLFHRRAASFEVVGVARAEVHDIGTNIRARLVSVPVQLFDKVNKGDPVAVVTTVPDDERIESEIATIQAQINHLDAQLTELRKNYEALIFNQESEWWAELRAFTDNVVMAKSRIIDANLVLKNDLAELKKMNEDIDIFSIENGANFGTDIALYNKLKTMEATRDRLREKVERDKGVLVAYEKELKEAVGRKERYIKYRPKPGTDPNEARRVIYLAKEALERRKDELMERQSELVLMAPCDGFISSIDARIGEVVIIPDAPIMSIAEEEPNIIIAYASEELVGHFAPEKPVELIKSSEPKQIGRSKITHISPRVEQMPVRLWQDPAIPRWGRAMQIEIPLGMKLIPGEMVGVRKL